MIATKFATTGVILSSLTSFVVGNPIHLPIRTSENAELPAQNSNSVFPGIDELVSKPVAEPYVVEIRDIDTTPPSSLDLTTITTTTTSERCAITLYRPTPYTQGSIKTVWASTHYYTSYQPCFDCTLFTYNPFTWKILIKWESTTTVTDTPRYMLRDRCEPTKTSKSTTLKSTTTKSSTTRKITTTSPAPDPGCISVSAACPTTSTSGV